METARNVKLMGLISRFHDSEGIEYADRVTGAARGEGRPRKTVGVTSKRSDGKKGRCFGKQIAL